MRVRGRNQGFTLIELMVVMALIVILAGIAGLWLAGNWQLVGWTLVAVACLLWLPYALERQAADRESGCWSLGAASQRRIHAGLAVKPGRV